MAPMVASPPCTYCQEPAAFRIDGWADDGRDEGPVYSLACALHVLDFSRFRPFEIPVDAMAIHGWTYYESIKALPPS